MRHIRGILVEERDQEKASWFLLMVVFFKGISRSICLKEKESLSMSIRISLRVNSLREKRKGKVDTFSVRALCLMETGKMIKKLKESSPYSMVIFSRESLKIIFVIKDFTTTKMEMFIKGVGIMILNRAQES